MKPPRIRYAEAMPEYQLLLLFENGTLGLYNLLPKLNNPIYAPLKDEVLFKALKIDGGGYGISWNEDIDLSEKECWENSKKIGEISRLIAQAA